MGPCQRLTAIVTSLESKEVSEAFRGEVEKQKLMAQLVFAAKNNRNVTSKPTNLKS